jgi:hypothetical protein
MTWNSRLLGSGFYVEHPRNREYALFILAVHLGKMCIGKTQAGDVK